MAHTHREKIIEVMADAVFTYRQTRELWGREIATDRIDHYLNALEAAGYKFAGPDEVVVPDPRLVLGDQRKGVHIPASQEPRE